MQVPLRMRWKSSISCSIAVFLALCPGIAQAQHYGFGIVKKTVTLQRRLLPDVRLGQESVQVVFPRGTGGLDGNLFSSDLETQVAQNSGVLRLVSQRPEYEIRCYTTAYQPAQITSKTEAGPKIFGKAAKPTTEREAHGAISLDARLTRVSDGAVLVAFSEAVSLNASSGAGAGATTFTLPSVHIPGLSRAQPTVQPTTSAAADPLADTDTNASLTGKMVKTLALRVASHLVQMDEQITVLLGQGGALDEASRLAINGRWSEYLEKLSAITPPADAADNAYLLYDLGVANEALGYAAGDAKATLKYLQESSIDFTKATEAKPSEKYFAEPQKRIETAITRYTRLAEQERAPAPAKRQEPEHRAKAGERITNADVIKLVKAHLDKSLILNKIATAPEADFDLSVDGMVSLSQSGVPSDVIRAMTARSQTRETAH